MNWPGIVTTLILMVVPFFMSYHTDKIEDACSLDMEKGKGKDKS